MRLDRLTNPLQVALSDAQSLAVVRDHNQLDPLHLLSAMLDRSPTFIIGHARSARRHGAPITFIG